MEIGYLAVERERERERKRLRRGKRAYRDERGNKVRPFCSCQYIAGCVVATDRIRQVHAAISGINERRVVLIGIKSRISLIENAPRVFV